MCLYRHLCVPVQHRPLSCILGWCDMMCRVGSSKRLKPGQAARPAKPGEQVYPHNLVTMQVPAHLPCLRLSFGTAVHNAAHIVCTLVAVCVAFLSCQLCSTCVRRGFFLPADRAAAAKRHNLDRHRRCWQGGAGSRCAVVVLASMAAGTSITPFPPPAVAPLLFEVWVSTANLADGCWQPISVTPG